MSNDSDDLFLKTIPKFTDKINDFLQTEIYNLDSSVDRFVFMELLRIVAEENISQQKQKLEETNREYLEFLIVIQNMLRDSIKTKNYSDKNE